MSDFIDLLKDYQINIALETQGSKWQDWFYRIDDLTLSPKPPSSMMSTNFDVLDDIMTRLTEADRAANISLKVVVFDDRDFDYAKKVHKRYPHVSFYLQVGNRDPVTENKSSLTTHLLEKYEWLTEKTVADRELNDARVLPQLHTLMWGNKRGV
jgi:7-carboxy-7-deazaguanine synthase